MFNSVCACQSTLKMQVALGAVSQALSQGDGTDLAHWDLLGNAGNLP